MSKKDNIANISFKSIIRKTFALVAAIILSSVVANYLGLHMTKENGTFLSWDYLILNKMGLWLYFIAFFSIFIGDYRRKNIGILLELLAIAGVVMLYPQFCKDIEGYSYIRKSLDGWGILFIAIVFLGLGFLGSFF